MRMWEKNRSLKKDNWSYLKTGVELAALAVQTPKGFKIIHWAPQGGVQFRLSNKKIRQKLTHIPKQKECCPVTLNIQNAPSIEDYGDSEQRQALAQVFFKRGILRFYRRMNKFADKYHLSRNIKFGLVGEMMTLLWFGLRGCRTKKGGDAYEEGPGLIESEIKTVVGEKTEDFMNTSNNNKVIHLKDDITNLLSQRRWFFNRIIDPLIENEDGTREGNLQWAIFTLTEADIALMHTDLIAYFSNTNNVGQRGGANSKGYRDDPQFNPSDQFEDNHLKYGWNERGSRLPMVRIVEFREKKDERGLRMRVISEAPDINQCQCQICQGGGAYWDPEVDRPALGRLKVQLSLEGCTIQSELERAVGQERRDLEAQLEDIEENLRQIGQTIGNALIIESYKFARFWQQFI